MADVMITEYDVPALDASNYSMIRMTKTLITKHRFKHNNRILLTTILSNMRSHVDDIYNESVFDDEKIYNGLVYYVCDSCRIMIP